MDPGTETTPSLEDILDQAWSDLANGVASARDPFHTPTISTQGPSGPEVRTVVLRGADARHRELIFNTDVRSPKYGQLRAEPAMSWLFYDRERKVQIRANGFAKLHVDDEFARQRWQAATTNSRWCYSASEGPGTPISRPDELRHEVEGFPNFAAVCCTVVMLDWLYLRAGGHLRCQFAWNEDAWDMRWVAP